MILDYFKSVKYETLGGNRDVASPIPKMTSARLASACLFLPLQSITSLAVYLNRQPLEVRFRFRFYKSISERLEFKRFLLQLQRDEPCYKSCYVRLLVYATEQYCIINVLVSQFIVPQASCINFTSPKRQYLFATSACIVRFVNTIQSNVHDNYYYYKLDHLIVKLALITINS